MRLMRILTVCLMSIFSMSGAAQDWQSLWKSYVTGFMDGQVRVIDHDSGDRTTSEGQAYGMFFALVANDRSHFDGLLKWTETNLAAGDLSTHLPAWLWGRGADNQWSVLDHNSASDADLWMAYTLLEAGRAWKEPRYTKLGMGLAQQIATQEVVQVPGLGTMVEPGQTGFQHGNTVRLNASYVPLQVILQLDHAMPSGPWKEVATGIPAFVSNSAPHGFVSDWTDFTSDAGKAPIIPTVGSYDAIRVYLWAGMLDKATPHREDLLKSIEGMTTYLRTNDVPPAKVQPDGTVADPNGPPGFSAALLPYAAALQDAQLQSKQMSRLQASFKPQTGLYGAPAKYYDQNLALFGVGYLQQQFAFDSSGALKLKWKRN
jgi:endo-1,4-beta-D-glucanase Y